MRVGGEKVKYRNTKIPKLEIPQDASSGWLPGKSSWLQAVVGERAATTATLELVAGGVLLRN